MVAGPGNELSVAGRSGISQARMRLGWEPLRQLHDDVVGPIATERTKGAWYRSWRLVSLDGSTLDVADTKENEKAFGRPGGRAPTRNCALSHWSKMGRTFCLAARWRSTPWEKPR